MDARTSVGARASHLVTALFLIFALVYLATGGYFFFTGLRSSSGGGVLLALACWSGVPLFLTPLWLVHELRRQTEVLERQNRYLLGLNRTLTQTSTPKAEPELIERR